MALPTTINDRHWQSYRDAGTLQTAVAVEVGASPTNFARKLETATITWSAATTGAIGAHPLATVTGVVAVTCFAKVLTDATSGGAATVEVGTALSTAGLIPLTTFDKLDASELWHDATPDTSIELTSVLTSKIVSQSINVKITDATLTGGTIVFYISWYPISSDGNVVMVTPFA